MDHRWFIQRTNREFLHYLARSAGISPVMAQVLINRGLRSASEVASFLGGALKDLPPPQEQLQGLREAVKAIEEARALGKKVLLWGDYDVDGLCSAALMLWTLRRLGLECFCHIPSRFEEGYGLHPSVPRLARSVGASLVITTDCGATSFEAARALRAEGLGLIITDHHEPLRDEAGRCLLPPAVAVINPRLHGGPPLCAAGVALWLARALLGEEALQGPALELAALATVADMVPLRGENRILLRAALAQGLGQVPAVKALMEVAGLRSVSAEALSYTLIPRLNAPGRMGRAQEVPQWLLASQEATALEGAQRLEALNKARQQTEEAVYQEARAQVEALGELPGALVLAGQGWHLGVLGIVASRLAEEFYRPTVVLALEGDTAKGSARSIAEFDLLSALQRLRGRLLQFGGHRQAAGLKLRRQDLEGFGEALSELALQEVQDFSPALKIDAEVSLRDVDFPLVRELQALEPLGAGNPPALLGARGLRVWGAREVGSGHLKLRLADEFTTREAIGFSLARHLPQLKEGSVVDAAFRAEENEFNGTRSLQLNLQALRSAKNA